MNYPHYFRIICLTKPKNYSTMSLLMNSMPVTESKQNSNRHLRKTSEDELILSMKTINTQKSTMKEDLKRKKRGESPSLEELLVKVINQKGEGGKFEMNRVSDNEIELEGISQMTLHSFLLKAEELGKNITYTRSLKVTIAD